VLPKKKVLVGRGRWRVMREVIMVKVHYIHVWKCHNETHHFVQLIYANFKKKKNPSRIFYWINNNQNHFEEQKQLENSLSVFKCYYKVTVIKTDDKIYYKGMKRICFW
jgi:hypothetical protein